MPLLKERVGEAFPLKEMSRRVAHSKTRDNHLPNPAVIQEPPLSKERPISRTVATVSVLYHAFLDRREERIGWVSVIHSQGHIMNQEQFGQFWTQLKAPLKAKWEKITDGDLVEIEGDLARFSRVVEKRYGEAQKDEVLTWVNRRYSHWTGNYVGMGYKDADPKRP